MAKKSRKQKIQGNTQNYRTAKSGRLGTGSYVPAPMQVKMMEMFAAGMFVTEIAARTKRNWRTVSKIVNSPEMTQYIQEEQKRTAELIGPAREVVEEDIVKNRNADRAAWLMEAFGVVPSGRQSVLQMNMQVNNNGKMTEEQFEAGVETVAYELMKSAMERSKVFGTPMPEMDGLETVSQKKPVEKGE